MSENENQDYQQKVSALKNLDVQPSPYMKTRLMAQFEDMKKQKQVLWWQRWFFVAPLTASFVLIISFVSIQMLSPQQSVLNLNQPYIVKADLRSFSEIPPAFVQVELEEGLEFSSKKFSKINEMRTIYLSWEQLAGKQYLPVVVRGIQKGTPKVLIKFFDQKNQLIKTESFQLHITSEAS